MNKSPPNMEALLESIQKWTLELGFQQMGVSDINLDEAETRLLNWLDKGYHGSLHYMEKHGLKRTRPDDLVAGTQRVISVRMDYFTGNHGDIQKTLDDPIKAFISRYALGRDYHKIMRNRLQTLATRIQDQVGPFGYRAFVDSGPVMEKPLAEKAGLGWIGKHTNLLNETAGSWFFLGELYTDLPLPINEPAINHCGDCHACLTVCPTQAIVAPYELDARRCISYLTIESPAPIPIELRPKMGNRIYGCDDCQMVCPWNRFASNSEETDFTPRNDFNTAELVQLFMWDETEFLTRTEGSAIRRIGHQSWLRNIAVALGNSPKTEDIVNALKNRLNHPSELVKEHVQWALSQSR